MSDAVQHPDENEDDPYQVMPDLGGEQFERLKQDIEANGVEYPIIVNGDGEVIDGHHRRKAWVELGNDPGELPKRIVDEPEQDNYHRAFRANLLRRDLTDGTKRDVVKQYLLEHPERVEEDTQEEIASDLGVSRETVRRAKADLDENGKLAHLCELSTEEKKELVKEYVDENPDDSNREVAKNVDCEVSHVSVGNWRPEEKDADDTTGLDTFTTSSEEEEKTFDVLDEAKAGNETAQEEAGKVGAGETTPDKAHKTVERQQQREEKQEQIDETPEVPDGQYEILLADPPWQYDHQQSPNRDIENHYLTMSLSEIKDMDVPAADNAVLYLWTTAPKLEEAFGVLDAWGFEYTTCAVWDKQKIGMGYWFRGQHELILVAKRGSFSPPEPEDRVSSVISEPRGEHSEKPDALHELIEESFPNRSKIELFARDARDGWDSWGDEV